MYWTLFYKYSSLAELNALLKLYNVIADRGEKDSKIFEHHGLVYRVLDKNGNKIGVPIKASAIYNKPTLSFLEERFKENEVFKQPGKRILKSKIDWVLVKSYHSLDSFQKALEKEKISLVIRQNEQGIIYGLTYIDHNTKTICNGSDIGKEYSAKAILERCQPATSIDHRQTIFTAGNNAKDFVKKIDRHLEPEGNLTRSLDVIITPVEQYGLTQYPFKKRKKKKRKSSN